MAPGQVHMEAPVCLIENMPDGKLVVNREAAEVLARIRQPVVVVAIAGLYRTGKSYLMNRLAGKRKGFCLGTTVQAQTKGIWMWCLPHPKRPDFTLVLLDTEGLGDVQKGGMENDSWIFALAILLSSTLVYNSMGTIDETAIEKLHYVTELTKAIRAKYPSGDGQEEENFTEFGRFFPDLVWALRDFTLQLQLNGRPISADKYLENALRFLQGDAEHIQKHNMARSCIHSFFPSRKCFIFDRPTNRKKLHLLEELKEKDLEEDFLVPMAHFCQHIWETSRPKMIPGDRVVTGTMLASLAKTYVNAINSGDVPCLQNAVLALSKIENSAAVHDAISCYEERMQQLLQLPTDTLEELLRAHAKCEREAIDVFIARAFGDNVKQFQEELEADRALEEFLKSKEMVAKSILHMDNALSGKEKEIEAQRAQVEATQLQQRLLEQELANLEQMMEDKKRHNEEGIQRLKEEWEEEMKKMKEEAERRKRDFRKGLLRQRFLLMAMETEVELLSLKA
ncbi:guanylate-binding protein 1-like isoform X2 [Podarcis muralis]